MAEITTSATTGADPNDPSYDERPWGSFAVLDEGAAYKVKRIEVKPGARLSYQYHRQRAELWVIVAGRALVTLDDIVYERRASESIEIGTGVRHRIENPGPDPMAFIEVQTGTYFGEDDIVRLDDDYGRQDEPTS